MVYHGLSEFCPSNANMYAAHRPHQKRWQSWEVDLMHDTTKRERDENEKAEILLLQVHFD